jgi:hypothetical protein
MHLLGLLPPIANTIQASAQIVCQDFYRMQLIRGDGKRFDAQIPVAIKSCPEVMFKLLLLERLF